MSYIPAKGGNLQNNDVMTDAGREELQIPKHDKISTPHGAPDEVPNVEVQSPLPCTVQLRFCAPDAPRWGKHKRTDLLHSAFSTGTPLDLVFDEDRRGKRSYCAVHRESGKYCLLSH